MGNRFLGIFMFLLVMVPSFAGTNSYENEDDKQINAYLQHATRLFGADNKKAKVYLDSAYLCLIKNDNKELYAEYYYILSVYYQRINDVDRMIEYSFKAYNLFKKTDNFKRIADCYFMMGRNHIDHANADQGIAELLRASDIYDSLNLKREYIRVQTSLGKGFYFLKDYNKAREYFSKVKIYADNNHDTTALMTSLNNLGIICDELAGRGNHEAMEFYRRAIKICETQDSETGVIPFYSNLGFDYFIRGRLDSAFILYRKALTLARKHNDYNMQLTLAENIGWYYNKKCMYDSAMYFINDGLKLQSRMKQNLSMENLLLLKSEVLSNQRKYKEAYSILKERNRWQDSVYNKQILKTSLETEAKYENQKKLEKLELQQKEIDAQESRNRLLSSVIVLLAMLIFSSFYFLLKISAVNKSLKQKSITIVHTNKELQEVIRTRDKMTSIIAHDIRNPLSAIAELASLSLYSEKNNADELHQYSKLILDSSSSLLDLLNNLLQWTKSQTKGIKVNLQDFTVDDDINQIAALLNSMAADKQIEIQNLCANNLVVRADPQMLNTIFRNIITNAIKFTGRQGWIKISSSLSDGYVRINIQDNGVGISQGNIVKLFDANADRKNISNGSNKGLGLGLLLCDDFIKQNKGFIKVASEEGKGSCFSVYIPQASSKIESK